MSEKRQRKPRQVIDLEQLRNDPNSFLHLRLDDPVLRKLETYRLYQAGYAAVDIAEAFGYARPYLYELWAKFEQEGSEASQEGLLSLTDQEHITGKGEGETCQQDFPICRSQCPA